jgi:hypothetical protein
MANFSESVIISARAAKDASSTGATAQTTLFCITAIAIITACDAGAYSCTSSIAGATSENLQALLEVLHTSGFQTSIATTTLTTSWAA